MSRYVLKFPGADPPPADLARLERLPEVTILDRTTGAMLVDASEEAVRLLRDQLPDWALAPETTFPPPEAP